MSLRWLLLPSALAIPILFGSPSSAEDLREEVRKGWDLTFEQAAALEQQLAANPRDLNSRAQLLGYYFRQRRADPARQAEHVVWFIRNAPESDVLEGPEGRIMPMFNPDGFAEAKEAWLQTIEDEPRNVAFLRHAAAFFTLTDDALSAQLLERAEGVEPSNPRWATRLGHLRWREARNLDGWNTEQAARALADFERAYALADADGRSDLLTELGKAAFVAGDLEKARTYAEKMIENIPDDWNRGNRLHFGNLVLGRIALADDDLEGAAQHLLAAGRTPGSPQLGSFGPDMSLARDLLDRGQTQTVVRYLQQCLEFWELGQEELKNWITLIEAGRTPDFRRNFRF